MSQRRRDDNQSRVCVFEVAERKIIQKCCFSLKRRDNKISKVQISLWRNFVVIAQAPNIAGVENKGTHYLERL